MVPTSFCDKPSLEPPPPLLLPAPLQEKKRIVEKLRRSNIENK